MRNRLKQYGGGSGVRDSAALDAAVAMPRATFEGRFLHGDLFLMAAAYAFHIAQDQPFVDGNKRTGLMSALVFLELNGISIFDPEGRLYQAMIGLAAHSIEKEQLASILRELAMSPL